MTKLSLIALLNKQFPNAAISGSEDVLRVGSFPEWDSLAHFNFLLLVEEAYNIRFSIDDMAELKSLSDITRALTNQGVVLP